MTDERTAMQAHMAKWCGKRKRFHPTWICDHGEKIGAECADAGRPDCPALAEMPVDPEVERAKLEIAKAKACGQEAPNAMTILADANAIPLAREQGRREGRKEAPND